MSAVRTAAETLLTVAQVVDGSIAVHRPMLIQLDPAEHNRRLALLAVFSRLASSDRARDPGDA